MYWSKQQKNSLSLINYLFKSTCCQQVKVYGYIFGMVIDSIQRKFNNIINKLKEKYEINISVVPLGGNYSFWTHLKNITLPIIFHSLKNKKILNGIIS